MKSWFAGFLIGTVLGVLATLAGSHLLSKIRNHPELAQANQDLHAHSNLFSGSIDFWHVMAAWHQK